MVLTICGTWRYVGNMPPNSVDPEKQAASVLAKECNVKGQSFRAFLAALAKVKGLAAVAATTAGLPREIREAIERNTITMNGWYPMTWYAELHAAAQRACPGAVSLARQLGQAQMRAELRGIYKFVLGFFKPSTAMRYSSRVFEIYCQGGKLKVTDSGPTFARMVYEDCVGSSANVWQDVIGSSEALLEASGARAVASIVKSGGGDGDAHMTLDMHWELASSS